MRIMIAALGLALLTTACGDTSPAKRQPGSWSQKVQIIEFAGDGITPESKAKMQQMMDAMARKSVCITPEFSAREDREKALTSMGGAGMDCALSDKTIGNGRIAFTATCKRGGETARTVADGTLTATEQNVKMTIDTIGDGKKTGKLVMTLALIRNGDCKPGELTPPPLPIQATPAPKA